MPVPRKDIIHPSGIWVPRREPVRGYRYIDPRKMPPLPDVGRMPAIIPLQCAPAFSAENHIDYGSNPQTYSVTINAGDSVLICIANGSGIAVSAVTDSGGSTYSRLVSKHSVGQSEIWGVLSANASTTITVTMAAAGNMNISVVRFTGVSSFGNTGVNSALSTSFSVSLTLQTTGNYMVAAFCADSGSMGTISAEVGTPMERGYTASSGGQTQSTYYNTGSAGSLSCSFTGSNNFWEATAVELVAAAAAGGGVRNTVITQALQRAGNF